MKTRNLTFIFLSLFFTSNAQDGEQSGRNSVVKFSPSKLMRGEILFSYERKIAEQASMELSFGPAISNVSPINFDHLFGNATNASESSLLGFASSIAVRYYPLEGKDALEGFYISPSFGFTQLNYNFSANQIGGISSLPDKRGHSNQSSFVFLFGTQKWLSKTFSLDMFLGSGIKQIQEQNFYINYLVDGFGNQKQEWVEVGTNDVQWYITGGIKVGIGFGKKK